MAGQPREFQRVCACGTSFSTNQPQRFRCFTCSPARLKPAGSGPPSRVPPQKPAEPESGAPVPSSGDMEPPKGKLEERIHEALDKMALLTNWKAELALGLARDLDRPGVTGAPRTSMTKQLFALMDEFEGRRPPETDGIDELEAEADRLRGLS